jgi:CRP-like cAMP-binding protein
LREVEKSWTDKLYIELTKHTSIPESEWSKLMPMISVKKYKKNDFFIREGDIPETLAFIVLGIFRAFYISEKAEERVLVFRAENKFLTAFSSFLENTPSGLSLQALEDSLLLSIPLREYKGLLEGHSCWHIVTSKLTQQIFIEKEKREKEFLSDDAETRYLNFVRKYSGIESRINQYHIASYLGISPVTLSRIKSNL